MTDLAESSLQSLVGGYSGRIGLIICAIIGFLGVHHYKTTTSGGTVSGDILVWLAYFTTPATSLLLFFKYRTISPIIVVLYLAYSLLTKLSLGGGPDGYYPGLIIVVWPATIVIDLLLAGLEIATRGFIFR